MTEPPLLGHSLPFPCLTLTCCIDNLTFCHEYFQVNVMELSGDDQVLGYGELGNFSVAGFEMVLNR